MKRALVRLVRIGCCLFAASAFAGATFEVVAPLNPYPDGYYSVAGLVQGADGAFYGTTKLGGNDDSRYSTAGTVFRVTADGTLTSIFGFSGTNGAYPEAALIQAADGNLYGTTYYGGADGNGTIFRVTTNGVFTNLVSLSLNASGVWPEAPLIQGGDGNLYGVTSGGGPNNGKGTVIKLTTNGLFTVLYTFTNNVDGSSPRAGLVQGSDGNLYGTTFYGGDNAKGTLFRLTTNGIKTTLISFNGANGANPKGELLQGSDGNLYGTTLIGGSNQSASIYGTGFGTVFRITPAGSFTTLFSFDGTNGANPYAGLRMGGDGKLYGTTYYSTVGPSAVFQLTTNGILTTLAWISGSSGSQVYSSLVQGSDGRFYGTTASGGNGAGTVFRLGVPMPAFVTIGRTGSLVTLTWTAVVGQTYQVQFNSDSNSTNWSNLGSTITATNSTATISDSSSTSSAQRLYRVVCLP